jgi:hypothetical protein
MAERSGLDSDARWAADHAVEVIARARAEALEEARERLRARLVDALLAAAEAAVAPPAPEPAPPPATGPRAAEPRIGLWLYGVLPGDVEDPPRLLGVDGKHHVEVLRQDGLAALVSAVPLDAFGEDALRRSLEDLGRLESLARGHEQVLDEALGLGALVPFRLCTIYEQADGLREMLRRERETLVAALDRLAGMGEWGVKGFLVAPQHEESAATRVDTPASGTDYLSRKRHDREAAETARQAVEAGIERVHARLSEQAASAVVSRPHDRRLSGRDDEMVLNGAYLVPDVRAHEFRALVDEIAERDAPAGLVLELTGPWPAYHFVEAARAS